MEAPAPPTQDTIPVIPWEDRGRSSFDALFETVKLLVISPTEAFRRMPVVGGVGRPLFFAIAIGWIGIAVSVVWNVLFQGVSLPFVRSTEDLAGLGAMYGLTVGWALLIAVLAPLFIVIYVFVAAAILHLMLLVVGGADNGFEATVRVVCYTHTAELAGLIPCCGWIFGLIWTIVLYVTGFSTAHRTTQGKALVAVLLPLVLCCAMSAVIFLVIGGIAGIAAATQ
jgi:hypothetical protein